MANNKRTDKEILAQIPAARDRARNARKAFNRAVTARYSRSTEQVTVVFANNASFSFPAHLAPALKKATPAQLQQVEVSPSGEGLVWPDIDADMSVGGMLETVIGASVVMSELGRIGGRARSDAKLRASRLNGAKGGRPKTREFD